MRVEFMNITWLHRFAMALLVALVCYTTGWLQGTNRERASARAALASQELAAQQALTLAMQRAIDKEHETQQRLQKAASGYYEEQQRANREIDTLRGAVRRGALRLSVATLRCTTADDSAIATGVAPGRAELDPGVADALIDIARRGDDNARQLNLCIDAYNAVRAAYDPFPPAKL